MVLRYYKHGVGKNLANRGIWNSRAMICKCFMILFPRNPLFTSTRNADTHYFSIWRNSTCRSESVTGHAIEKVGSVFFTQRKKF